MKLSSIIIIIAYGEQCSTTWGVGVALWGYGRVLHTHTRGLCEGSNNLHTAVGISDKEQAKLIAGDRKRSRYKQVSQRTARDVPHDLHSKRSAWIDGVASRAQTSWTLPPGSTAVRVHQGPDHVYFA
jgi:hypothetical protein